MWFNLKRDVAPLYKDETQLRLFTTTSGRPKGAEKLKGPKLPDSEEVRRWRRWFSAHWYRRPTE